ncbi:hypothetical protein HFP15_19025 [Amycolatopsis sp. K13G38]|uniref:Uncharacterized protein n=1 Tax=Amycolatopsis acididurans TaxID=2724524 RepID=A0ABX1J929_9PSEU|nr:hypothetical protein [Amycolatopsis acididurans]NKQ54980.1 hypothetical protein [Amycolatopsis acididurans]
MNWEFPATTPAPVITAEREDGTIFVVDQWRLASAVTLLSLWAKHGVLRLSASGWALAWEDVQRGYEWGVLPQRVGTHRITLHLHDTRQTEPSRVELIDITRGPDGDAQARHSAFTAPRPGLSGDTDTDTHLAIMLTMLRENGGTLAGRLDQLLATADMIQTGHEWRAVELPVNGDTKTFHLAEPARQAASAP